MEELHKLIVPKGSRRPVDPPPPLPNVEHVTNISILEVIIQDNLSMGGHVAAVVSRGAQSLFAL